ncbi:hypothetical protein [Kitasatospora sp. NPDC058046]|uniref:hypothetical protein n=1 Tax=Kitasatospora sp. NPDC058046 TaxID=3346312 RepID=UPI0036DE0347
MGIAWHHPLATARVKQIAAQLAPIVVADGARRAYLSGPALAGLATAHAEIEACVVTDSPWRVRRRRDPVLADGRPVTIRYVTFDEFSSQCVSLLGSEPELSTLCDLQQAARFLLGQDVIDDDGALEALRKTLDANAEALIDTAVSTLAKEATTAIQTCFDILDTRDTKDALRIAQDACLSATDALLASHGDLYLGTAWLRPRWARTFRTPFPELPDSDSLWEEPFCERAALLYQDLLVQAVTGTTYASTRHVLPGTYRRDPAVTLVPDPGTEDIRVLKGRRPLSALSPLSLLLWGVAHGRERRDALAETLRLAEGRASIDDLSHQFDRLVDIGMLQYGCWQPD